MNFDLLGFPCSSTVACGGHECCFCMRPLEPTAVAWETEEEEDAGMGFPRPLPLPRPSHSVREENASNIQETETSRTGQTFIASFITISF